MKQSYAWISSSTQYLRGCVPTLIGEDLAGQLCCFSHQAMQHFLYKVMFLPAVEVQQRTTTTTASTKRKTARTKRAPAPKRVRTVSPGIVSICSTDSELSSLAGDSDSDGTLDCLFDIDMDELADEASTASTVSYTAAAMPTLDVGDGRAGMLEKGADDLRSWIDILLSDE